MQLRKMMITAAITGMMLSTAMADEFVEWCVAAAPAEADMAAVEATCNCLAAATQGDEDVRASMLDAGDIEDRQERFAALSGEAQDAVSSCR